MGNQNAATSPSRRRARPIDIERDRSRFGRGFVRPGVRLTSRTSSIRPRSAVGEADDACGGAARGERALKALDQPGAERVQPLKLARGRCRRCARPRNAVRPSSTILSSSAARSAVQAPVRGERDAFAVGRCRSSEAALIENASARAPRRAARPLSCRDNPGHSAPRMELSVRIERWPLAGAFTISRGSKTEAVVVVAELSDGTHRGRGESVPYARYGETPDGIVAAIEAMRPALQRGLDRAALQRAMPAGAARNALDCAYWDVNAKQPAAGRMN